MNRKNNTRKQLLVSLLSLLLCVSMLVGATFAWFTDSVVSGMNTIEAGNLDVELLADGVEVDESTKLFGDVELWEPGVVVYENLQVWNKGNLALKYQLSLNFGNENYLNGHGLSEVLKIAAIDKIDATADRAAIVAAAKADAKALNLFLLKGELLPGEKSAEQSFVIFWEPNDNDVDNLYNANNDQVTSDGEALHIDFGVNLQAIQLMYEEDSFGNDYDEFAEFLPNAGVNDVTAKYETVDATLGMGGEVKSLTMPFVRQFLPTESYEQAQKSIYRYWHADFVITADQDVPAESMALAGYYVAFCDDYNDGNWVYLTSDQAIPANTEIRLVEMLGNGSITVNYEEICKYANDGVGFLCGATELIDGANAGTTITVELRLYETTGDYTTDYGSKNEETGEYIVAGTYTYTF